VKNHKDEKDMSAKVEEAIEFWNAAKEDTGVMNWLERCILGLPVQSALNQTADDGDPFDAVAASKQTMPQEPARPSQSEARKQTTLSVEATGRKSNSQNDDTSRPEVSRTVTVSPPELAEQGRQLCNAIAEMFGENPRLYAQGVPGDTVEVQLKLRRVVDAIKDRPELVVLLMRTVIPATLRRLAGESNLSPELAVDIVTLTIGDLRPKRQPEQQDLEMLLFFAAARALLEKQKQSGITAAERGGYYATRNAVAQYISSGRPSHRVLIRAVFYFEEVLFEYYQQMLVDPTFRLSKRCRRSLEVAGNNCGNHLDDLRLPGSDNSTINRLWANISGITVAVAVEENRGELATSETATIRQCLTQCFGELNSNSLDSGTLVAVDVMMYGPGAWRSEFANNEMLGLMLSAGLIRLARPSRHEDAVSPIFNAGVELLRLGEQASDPRRMAWQRVLVNATGLWWSLKLNPDWHTALTKFHGLDCLVNLWGSISDVKADLQTQTGQFYQDCLALYHWTKTAERVAPEQLADQERIRRSFVILGALFDGTAQRRPVMSDGFAPLDRICQHAIRCFAVQQQTPVQLPELAATGTPGDARDTSLRNTATYFGLLFNSLPNRNLNFDDVATKVQRFVPEEGKTEQRILGLMQEIWGGGPETQSLSSQTSVLAQAGIVNENDFVSLQQSSRDDDAARNYAFVENCEYSWLLI